MTVVIPQNKELNSGQLFQHLDLTVRAAQAYGNRVFVMEPFESAAVKVFRQHYKHHSPNPGFFEKWCFEQWILLSEWLLYAGLDCVFKIDSDVLLFTDVGAVRSRCPWISTDYITAEQAMLLPDQIIGAFKSGEARTICAKHGGHVCDMNLLPEFLGSSVDAAYNFHELAYDMNLYLCHTDTPVDGHKDIWFVNGQPLWVRSTGFTKMLSLHCWGPSKDHMPRIMEQSRQSIGNQPVRLTF